MNRARNETEQRWDPDERGSHRAVIRMGKGERAEARALYDWFLPLLRLDTVPKFVQLIKLVQAQTGLGSEPVRPPRLPLVGEEREAALTLIRESLDRRPSLG